jgi:hypothetical protein
MQLRPGDRHQGKHNPDQLTWDHNLGTAHGVLGVSVGGKEDAILAGQIAGGLQQLYEGQVKVKASNDPGHVLVEPQGVFLAFLHVVQRPNVRGWVRLTGLGFSYRISTKWKWNF